MFYYILALIIKLYRITMKREVKRCNIQTTNYSFFQIIIIQLISWLSTPIFSICVASLSTDSLAHFLWYSSGCHRYILLFLVPCPWLKYTIIWFTLASLWTKGELMREESVARWTGRMHPEVQLDNTDIQWFTLLGIAFKELSHFFLMQKQCRLVRLSGEFCAAYFG